MAEKRSAAKKKVAVVRPEVIETTFEGPVAKVTKLQKWNYIFAALYAVQGVALLLFSSAKKLPVTLSYLAQDPLQSAAQGKTILAPAAQHWFDINVVYAVVALVFVLAISHILAATWLRSHFEIEIERGVNKLRWATYAVSSSILLVVLSLLAGVQNAAVLLLVIACMAVLHFGGWLVESPGKPLRSFRKLEIAIGLIVALVPLIVIAQYLISASVYGAAPAAYLWWLYVTAVALFVVYGINLILQHKGHGKWASYTYGECVYAVTSVVGITLLVWQIFVGALR